MMVPRAPHDLVSKPPGQMRRGDTRAGVWTLEQQAHPDGDYSCPFHKVVAVGQHQASVGMPLDGAIEVNCFGPVQNCARA
jgi:hypothetical protein